MFAAIKHALANRATPTHFDPSKILCLNTDANDNSYAAFLTIPLPTAMTNDLVRHGFVDE